MSEPECTCDVCCIIRTLKRIKTQYNMNDEDKDFLDNMFDILANAETDLDLYKLKVSELVNGEA
jgi:hypothetical protein